MERGKNTCKEGFGDVPQQRRRDGVRCGEFSEQAVGRRRNLRGYRKGLSLAGVQGSRMRHTMLACLFGGLLELTLCEGAGQK